MAAKQDPAQTAGHVCYPACGQLRRALLAGPPPPPAERLLILERKK
jgi:hypothetical protein